MLGSNNMNALRKKVKINVMKIRTDDTLTIWWGWFFILSGSLCTCSKQRYSMSKPSTKRPMKILLCNKLKSYWNSSYIIRLIIYRITIYTGIPVYLYYSIRCISETLFTSSYSCCIFHFYVSVRCLYGESKNKFSDLLYNY